MTKLTTTLLEKLRLKERDAEVQLVVIARREAEGRATDDDAVKLEAALSKTGKPMAAYEQTVGILQQAKKLTTEEAKLPAASAAYVRAREAIVAYQAETKQIEKARREGQLQLELARNVEYSKHLMAVKAHSELERLEFSYPQLFDGKTIDLDTVTLTSGDGINVIVCHDPEAPKKEIPMGAWREESTRRARIRQAATAKARKEYQDKRNAWIEKQPRDYYGHYVSDEPFPDFEPPTWGQIVAKGWNKTLDGLAA